MHVAAHIFVALFPYIGDGVSLLTAGALKCRRRTKAGVNQRMSSFTFFEFLSVQKLLLNENDEDYHIFRVVYIALFYFICGIWVFDICGVVSGKGSAIWEWNVCLLGVLLMNN